MENFAKLGLDPRLVCGLEKLEITKPTLIQAKAIPLALEGKDILAKAKTGSGKTLAFLCPLLHHHLSTKPMGEVGQDVSTDNLGSIFAIILVPSKDLAAQICTVAEAVAEEGGFASGLAILNLAPQEFSLPEAMDGRPTLLIATPGSLLRNVGATDLAALKLLVVDEADLVLGFGFGQEMEQLLPLLPPTVQTILMSASITEEVEQLKALLLRNAVTLRLEETADEQEKLCQYLVKCSVEDKYLLIYVILKLGLIKGKILIFVNEVDACYRLRLFLEQFGIKAAVLNAQLPLASRIHLVDQYNRGLFDLLIASDASVDMFQAGKSGKDKRVNGKDKRGNGKDERGNGKDERGNKGKQYGAARGLDFKRVDVVFNFDFPPSVAAYVHRVGRTARNGEEGTAITIFTAGDDIDGLNSGLTEVMGRTVEPFDFDLAQIEGFRYRCQDAYRAVTGNAVERAKLKDLKSEILTSDRLKHHFEERPQDREALANLHTRQLLDPKAAKPHLKHIPAYLKLQTDSGAPLQAKALPQRKIKPSVRQAKGKGGRKSSDPLKTLRI